MDTLEGELLAGPLPAGPSVQPTMATAGGAGGPGLSDLLGIAWVIGAAIAVLIPALSHGASLGPYRELAHFGLTAVHNTKPSAHGGSDQITQLIPWASLAWTQVHQGHWPLWNPFSGLGMPLAFNWNSATFGLPALIAYAFPLKLTYTVQVLVTLVVAGTGAYFFGRLLRLSVLACVLMGTTFELSGAMMVWLGWPIASVLSWTGWLFAAVILILREGPRARHIGLFASLLAFAVYAGQPDALVVLLLGAAVFAGTLLLLRVPTLGGSGPIARPTLDLGLGVIGGLALAAPLLLPGLQVLNASIISRHRGEFGVKSAIAFKYLGQLAFAGLGGTGLRGVCALGAIVAVLAIVAVGLRRREREVIALAVVAVVMVAIGFFAPLTHALNSIPKFQSIKWARATFVLAFAVSALAGIGLDLMLRTARSPKTIAWVGGGFLTAGAALIGIWGLASGPATVGAVPERTKGIAWAVLEIGVGVAGAAVLFVARRHQIGRGEGARRWGLDPPHIVGALWVLCATSFLVATGSQLWSGSPSFVEVDNAELALQHAVGSALVGFNPRDSRLGIYRDTNDMFGVRELDVIDGSVPHSYFESWHLVTRQPGASAGDEGAFVYSPAITSAAIARAYGVGFVLEPLGKRKPRGAAFQQRIGNEDLFRISDSGPATLTPLHANGKFPSVTAVGRPVPVTYPSPSSWKLVADASSPQLLRLHLNNTPGWHATIDGRPLPLQTYAGVMLEARLPSGRYVVELNYWPATFTAGIILAIVAALVLIVAVMIEQLRRRAARRAGSAGAR